MSSLCRVSLSALYLALIANFAAAQVAAARNKPAVIAYVFPQETLLQPADVDGQSLTRINYAFANVARGRLVAGFSHDTENLATLTALRSRNPSLQVLVSVGGWTWSGGFSDVALTPESRRLFIQSAIEFINSNHLDGLDIDWEYPGLVGAGHPFRTEDKHNFTLLLGELRSAFDHQAKPHRPLILSIAAGASDEFLSHTEMADVQKYVDTVNLMAYDYYEPGSDNLTGHHAPLFTSPTDPKKISADASVHAFEAAGVPAAKIVLGIPFYGHVWGQVASSHHGLYQPGRPIPNAYAPYSSITTTMLSHGYQRFWDPAASAPYLYNGEKHIFVSYEDSQSIVAKCTYVLHHRLAGVMFWDYAGDDPSHRLLGTINSTLGMAPAH